MYMLTRMHSSRMRTGRSLTVCCSLLPGAGGVCLVPGGGCLPARSQGGFSLPGPRGVLPARSQGGGLPARSQGGGFSLPGPRGGCPETPPVNRITHTCKNVTLATTSLRPVKTVLQTTKLLGRRSTREEPTISSCSF